MNSEEDFGLCPIWKTPTYEFSHYADKDRLHIGSSRAGGSFDISGSAFQVIKSETLGWRKIALTEQIFLANIARTDFYIDTGLLANLKYPKKLSFRKKFDRFFTALTSENPEIGKSFSSREVLLEDDGLFLAAAINSSSTADANFADESQLLIETARARGFLEATDVNTLSSFVRVSALGWEYLESLGASISLSDQIFVAMWFGSQEQTRLYKEGIKPAIEAAGYNAVRIDDTEHNEKIDDQIIAEIRKSSAVIVDLTCGLAKPNDGWSKSTLVGAPRGGVFFEAGFAAGIGLPVIWTVKHSIADIENVVHFDVRQYNQIRWQEDFSDFAARLQYRIEATLGRGNAKAVR